MKYKSIAIVSIVAIVIIAVFLFIRWYYSPIQIFQRKFDFALPKSTKVINYDFKFFWEERLCMKASFDASDYDYMEKALENRFSHIVKNNPDYRIPNYHIFFSWWKIKKDEIIMSHYYMTSGRREKTREVDIIITLENGEYFLYVIH